MIFWSFVAIQIVFNRYAYRSKALPITCIAARFFATSPDKIMEVLRVEQPGHVTRVSRGVMITISFFFNYHHLFRRTVSAAVQPHSEAVAERVGSRGAEVCAVEGTLARSQRDPEPALPFPRVSPALPAATLSPRRPRTTPKTHRARDLLPAADGCMLPVAQARVTQDRRPPPRRLLSLSPAQHRPPHAARFLLRARVAKDLPPARAPMSPMSPAVHVARCPPHAAVSSARLLPLHAAHSLLQALASPAVPAPVPVPAWLKTRRPPPTEFRCVIQDPAPQHMLPAARACRPRMSRPLSDRRPRTSPSLPKTHPARLRVAQGRSTATRAPTDCCMLPTRRARLAAVHRLLPEEVSQDERKGGEFLAAAPYFRTLPIPDIAVSLTGSLQDSSLFNDISIDSIEASLSSTSATPRDYKALSMDIDPRAPRHTERRRPAAQASKRTPPAGGSCRLQLAFAKNTAPARPRHSDAASVAHAPSTAPCTRQLTRCAGCERRPDP
ncbi:hypothetical protein GGX14DRAFT_580830 [Mycena pura]|uniref:Uncharacterized protein n=1 Tax=Mycena pura TaxID=153505 RepID=A0AAD6Y0U9_9AGAR|nr:hypothetical protein GGX14DRAFT_580830 [Mycena pura]